MNSMQRADAPTDELAWYSFTNEAESDVAEVEIYDAIGSSSWFEERTSAKDFINKLKEITASTIRLKLNSPGGSVFDGVAIYNELRRHNATVEVHVDALAGSIASVVMLAGDRIIVNEGAIVMIHNPSTIAWGEAQDMRDAAEALDQVREAILEIYMSRTGQSREDLIAWMDKTSWMSGSVAVERGFAHEAAAGADDDETTNLVQFDARLVKRLAAGAPTEFAARLERMTAAPESPAATAPQPSAAETSTPDSVTPKPAASTEHDMHVRHLLATR